MSLSGRLCGRVVKRKAFATPAQCRVGVTCFSCSTRRLEDASRRAELVEGEEKPQSGRAKRSGWTLPAFVLFGVGLPLGWYFKTQFDGQHGAKVSDPREFVKYTLIGKDTVSTNSAIFRLRPSTNIAIDLDEPSLERAITSVEFKQPQLQIARSYTSLPQEEGQHMDELRFLIRREQKGEVSNFLHRLPLNSEIEVRGLHAEYVFPDDVKSVAFLVGGTGIAPAMQGADLLESQANMHILWASRRREDCIGGQNDNPVAAKSGWNWWARSSRTDEVSGRKLLDAEKGTLVSSLESLKRRSRGPKDQDRQLLLDYYVDEEGTMIKPNTVNAVLDSLSGQAPRQGRKVLIVSGPEGFINYWAGPKQWFQGREMQGPLKGVLATMDLRDWDIVKL